MHMFLVLVKHAIFSPRWQSIKPRNSINVVETSSERSHEEQNNEIDLWIIKKVRFLVRFWLDIASKSSQI